MTLRLPPVNVDQLSPQPLSVRANLSVGFERYDGTFEFVGQFATQQEAWQAVKGSELMFLEWLTGRYE